MTEQSLKDQVAERIKAAESAPGRRARVCPKPFRAKHRPEGYTTGRPTLYRPEYCQAVIDFMAQGYDLTAFAGSIDVSRETVYDWAGRFAEFRHALSVAKAKRLLALQTKLLTTNTGVGVTAAIFALKNADPDSWQDRHYNETRLSVSIERASDDELYAIIADARIPALIEAKAVEVETDVADTTSGASRP